MSYRSSVTYVFIVAGYALLWSHPALSSECDAVLTKDLQVNTVASADRKQAAADFACSHEFKEFNDTYGGSAQGQYGVIGGSGSYNQSNYQKFQSDHCQASSTSDHQSSFQYYALRDASSGTVSSWQQCMANRSGFNCWAEPENGDIAVVLSLREPGKFNVKDAVLSSGSTLASSPKTLAEKAIIKFGETRIVVKRPNQSVPVSLTINIEDELQAKGCRIAVPGLLLTPDPIKKACSKKGDYNFYGDHCGDSFSSAGTVEIVNFGQGGSTVVPKNIPTYNASLGQWLAGDFNGDGITDLVHLVFIPGVDPYIHVHFSQGKGDFAAPTPAFVLRTHANPQGDYNAAVGHWYVQYDPSSSRDMLVHNPALPDGRLHAWRYSGNGEFQIGVP